MDATLSVSTLPRTTSSFRQISRSHVALSVALLALLAIAALYYTYRRSINLSPSDIAELMLPKGERIMETRYLEKDRWLITTYNTQNYVLQKLSWMGEARFSQMVGIMRMAHQVGVAPELVGSSCFHKAILSRYIEPKPWPPFSENRQPYEQAMVSLRRFHSATSMMNQLITDYNKSSLFFPFYLLSGDVLNSLIADVSLPQKYLSSVKAISDQIYNALKEAQQKKSFIFVVGHGEFRNKNVVIHDNGATLTDFKKYIVMHPFADIVQFCIDLDDTARSHLLGIYLGCQPEEHHLAQFAAISLGILMHVTILNFRLAKHRHEKKGEPLLSLGEMETILQSHDSSPSFLSIPTPSSATEFQLCATYALKEFLTRANDKDLAHLLKKISP